MQLLTVIPVPASGLKIVSDGGREQMATLLGVEADGTVWYFDDNDWHLLSSEDGVGYHVVTEARFDSELFYHSL